MKNLNTEKHLNAFRQRELALADWYVFSIPGQWPTPKRKVSSLAAHQSKGDPRGEVTVAACRTALRKLLHRGWLQVITHDSAIELIDEHRKKGLPDPVYGFPRSEDVDFTRIGAEEYRRLSDELY